MTHHTNTIMRPGAAVKARIWRRSDWVFVANIALIFAVVSLFVGYLMMNNRAATKGFAIRNTEKRIAELRDEGRRLDLQMVSMQSMENIDSHVSSLGFVPISRVDYISAAPAVVAVK